MNRPDRFKRGLERHITALTDHDARPYKPGVSLSREAAKYLELTPIPETEK